MHFARSEVTQLSRNPKRMPRSGSPSLPPKRAPALTPKPRGETSPVWPNTEGNPGGCGGTTTRRHRVRELAGAGSPPSYNRLSRACGTYVVFAQRGTETASAEVSDAGGGKWGI